MECSVVGLPSAPTKSKAVLVAQQSRNEFDKQNGHIEISFCADSNMYLLPVAESASMPFSKEHFDARGY